MWSYLGIRSVRSGFSLSVNIFYTAQCITLSAICRPRQAKKGLLTCILLLIRLVSFPIIGRFFPDHHRSFLSQSSVVSFPIIGWTLTAWQTNTYTFVNSVDPDETARNEPSHQELHCLPLYFGFWLAPPFATVDMSKFKACRENFRSVAERVNYFRQVCMNILHKRNIQCVHILYTFFRFVVMGESFERES